MNDNERRAHMLDIALDGRRIGDASVASPELDVSELLATAREFGVLAATGGQEPDEEFVQRLELRLWPEMTTEVTPIEKPRPEMSRESVRDLPFTDRRVLARTSIPHVAVWAALIALLLGSATFLLWQLAGSEDARDASSDLETASHLTPGGVSSTAANGVPEGMAMATPAHESPSAAATPVSGFLWERVVTTASDNVNMLDTFVVGDSVYWFRTDNDLNGIEAIDGKTGETLWSVPAYGNGRTLRADSYGVYYVGFSEVTTREGGGSLIVALSPQSGQERWRLEIERSRPTDTSIDDGRLYVRHDNERLTAIDTETGEILWTAGQAADSLPCGTPWTFREQQGGLPAILDDAIVTFNCDGALVGYDPDTGAELWRSSGFNWVGTFLKPTGSTLVVMSAYRWEGMTGEPGSASPDDFETFPKSRFAVYRIVAIDGADGQTLWERFVLARPQFQAATESTFAVIGSEVPAAERDSAGLPATPTPDFTGIVVAPGVENHVMGFDLRSGELLWEETLEDDTVYRTLSAWSTETGSGIAATTSNFDIIQIGPWEGGTIVDPGDRFLVVEPPLAGDFGFVAEAIDGRLVGIGVREG